MLLIVLMKFLVKLIKRSCVAGDLFVLVLGRELRLEHVLGRWTLLLGLDEVFAIHREEVHEDVVFLLQLGGVHVQQYLLLRHYYRLFLFLLFSLHFFFASALNCLFQVVNEYLGILLFVVSLKNGLSDLVFAFIVLFVAYVDSKRGLISLVGLLLVLVFAVLGLFVLDHLVVFIEEQLDLSLLAFYARWLLDQVIDHALLNVLLSSLLNPFDLLLSLFVLRIVLRKVDCASPNETAHCCQPDRRYQAQASCIFTHFNIN